jgi:hypothetical protein
MTLLMWELFVVYDMFTNYAPDESFAFIIALATNCLPLQG